MRRGSRIQVPMGASARRPVRARRAAVPGRAVVGIAVLCALLVGPGMALGQSPPRDAEPAPALRQPPPPGTPGPRILLLYGEPRLTPAIVAVDAAIRSTFEERSPRSVTFYTEYLDVNLFDGDVPLRELRELLRRKYESRPIDLIVVAGSRVLRIAAHNRADLFSNAPIVFVSVAPAAVADLRLGPDVTGTWLHQPWAQTFEIARRLQPDVRRALVVTGGSPADRVWTEAARTQFAAADGTIELVYRPGPRLEDLIAEVKGLPRQTVVLLGPFLRDGAGRDFSTRDLATRVAAAASVPVYALLEAAFGTGIVGGQVVSFENHGKTAAALAARVLAGERPAPTAAGTTVPMFDERQLRRWGLDARRLPPDSRVLFQEPPSLWARYRWYLLGAVAVLLTQTGLIGALLVQRAQRRRAQERLAERLRFETLLSDLTGILADSSPDDGDLRVRTALRQMVETLDVDWAALRALEPHADELSLTHSWTRDDLPPRPSVVREAEAPWIFARLRQGHVVGVAGMESLPDEAAADRQGLEALAARSIVIVPLVRNSATVGCLSVGTVRDERRWPDEGTPRLHLLAEAFASALERQRAARAGRESQEAIRDLAGRLMTAQEEERRRIARDLHDDVNQELAAQSIALSTLGDRLPGGTAASVRQEVARLQARTVELARVIRDLSHSLHPGVLEHAGLVAALRSYCGAWQRENGLPVAFRADGDLGTVPSAVALCLYRVTQEGLGNVARHAKARRARVTVSHEGNAVVLVIGDDGRGFDPAEARRREGLGLISLDERVRLVGGRMAVDTQSQRGTELRIVVPLAEARDAARDRTAG